MREALEGTAAKLAAQHASEPEISMPIEINQQEPSMYGDARGLARLNRRFHTLIWMSAHNRFLLKSLDNMASTVALLPNSLNMDGLVENTHEEHRAIVEAIVSRDAVKAEEAARAHIRSTGRRRLEMLSQLED
ncbi:MAG: FCD domain-containing protein [Phyllobacteriaceae bacterium]|nr:FCD domain-containing protein [Phyllobacteriaceae bacterium]